MRQSIRQVLRSRSMVWCWVGLIAAGCSPSARPPSALTSDQSAALTAAEELWKRNAIRDYSFDIHPMAALSFGHDAGRIEVHGGVVTTVTKLSDLDPPRITIDELFANIHSVSKSGNYAKIAATYDPKLGYPTQINYRAREGLTDGNAIINITEFKDLRGR